MKRSVLLGALGLWLLGAVGVILARENGGLPLPHGSGKMPADGFRVAVTQWMLLGGLGLAALGTALGDHLAPLVDRARRGSDAVWVAGCALAMLGLGLCVERFVLLGLPISQDESVYRFASEIVASGRLYAESPPERAFYTTNLVVNDGRWYTQYFLGWPTLLAPFSALGVPGLANPVYAAASVPAVFLAVRHVLGPLPARFASLLFATAPLTVLAAGTQLSHTSTLFWLCWVAAFASLGRAQGRAPLAAGLAIAFCGAFFTRPTTALGIGGPFLLWWGADRLRAWDLRALVAFVVPAGVLAALFLAVNQLQNGSPTVVAYQAYLQFVKANGYAFTSVRRAAQVSNFRFDAWRVLAVPFEALYRLSYASFGWPFGFLVALPGLAVREVRVYAASVLGMLGVHCLLDATGMDLFGPVHFLETVLPLVVLTTAGVLVLWRSGQRWAVGAVVAAMLAMPLYASTRVQYMHANARVQAELYALADGLAPAVVFVEGGRWIPRCRSRGRLRIRHNFRPENPLSLDAPVLWLNDLGPERDRAFLARRYPDRRGYRMLWPDCRPTLVPL